MNRANLVRPRRWPLRARLVAGFSVATLVVLVAAGAFVYWRVDFALDRALDTELAHGVSTLGPIVGDDGVARDRDAAEAIGLAWQVVDDDGTVVDHGGPAGTTPMLVTSGYGKHDVEARLSTGRASYRIRAVGLAHQRRLLVGVRRDREDEALRELLLQLVVAGLGTLLVTAFVGDRLARAALRPVERYRQQAAAIATGAADLRLEVPAGRDDEVTRLGHTFNDMLAGLERALERERQFVAEASHELRTPLTLLTGRIQLARRRRRTSDEHERILDELAIDLDRLARLADQLLQVGAGPVGGGESDLAQVVARVVEERRVADPAGAAGWEVELLATTTPVGIADHEAERVLANLLDNAVRHGAPPVRLVVDRPGPGWVRLTVSDAGAGMPPALLATATQRFTRAEEARSRTGAGLGLALVAGIAERAGGQLRLCQDGQHVARPDGVVDLDCDHGAGLTVTVLLPTAAEVTD
ncbi:HAMP domain-containing sensor histidine kinase [Nocardioides sp. QY071]|uniref:sensor histidine kinase n=1 Tax=Nocardioides sp. QY071 TaxID=3044187 RepID=UPI00249A74C9|nr:HAMP domain-containing sensor histidine kinase [Nocardioides sp. QY071]WGY02471.1 HAMP domain-containing sensor histidine kinase [Nocardioides sp. QY071]